MIKALANVAIICQRINKNVHPKVSTPSVYLVHLEIKNSYGTAMVKLNIYILTFNILLTSFQIIMARRLHARRLEGVDKNIW